MVEKDEIQNLQDVANILRLDTLEMTNCSNSGHPTSGASMAELAAVLFFHESGMHYTPENPRLPYNDLLVLSKGHACPTLYSCWARAGAFPLEELKNIRKFTSDLEGHPTPRLNFIEFATGSLGQGLSNALGVAYSSKFLDNAPSHKVFCIIGDGESAEGSVYEAAHLAGYYKLDNLIAILDCNRLGQSDFTSLLHNIDVYELRFKAFGWHVITIDGHNISEIIKAYTEARNHTGSPVIIIAKTLKGKGFIGAEDKVGFHGKAMQSNEMIEHIKKQLVNDNPNFTVTKPKIQFSIGNDPYAIPNKYIADVKFDNNKKYSTREGVGLALSQLAKIDGNEKVVIGLDGDVKNSTYFEYLYKENPEKFINCFIAEQNMVGLAQGLSKRNKIPVIGTFAAFYSRAFDQIRMGGVSMTNVKYVGSHCGCHIGEDGPSQMDLEEIAIFRTVPEMVVLCPSDAFSSARAMELALNHKGSVFIRTGRNATETIYSSEDKFEIGKCQVLKSSEKDQITLMAHGATLAEILKAHTELQKEGIDTTVIDLFSIKPIDKEGLRSYISKSNKIGLVVEDHYSEGGAGEAVKSAVSTDGFKIYHQAVNSVPRSGKPQELFDYYGLSSSKIVEQVKSILSQK